MQAEVVNEEMSGPEASSAPAEMASDVIVGSVPVDEVPAGNAAEPMSAVLGEAPVLGTPVATPEEVSTLPLVPEGVVPEPPIAFQPIEDGELTVPLGQEAEEVQTLRFLGSSMGPELDYISPEEGLSSFGEVMIQLVDSALESEAGLEEELTGERVAQIFCRGDVEDDRVTFLLTLLAQNQPITAGLVLAAARAQGFEELVEQAVLSREELARAGDVSVEQLEASTGHFQVIPPTPTPERAEVVS